MIERLREREGERKRDHDEDRVIEGDNDRWR